MIIMNNEKYIIGVISKDYANLINSVEVSLKSIYNFVHIDNSLSIDNVAKINLIIIDGEDGDKLFEKLKVEGSISSDLPCILVSGNKAIDPKDLIIKFNHNGLVSVLRNYYGDYLGLADKIRRSLNPNMPIKNNKFLFVIPIYNEESRIQNVFDFLDILLKIIKKQNLDAKIKFVNDGSSDNSHELIDKIIHKIQMTMGSVHVDQFLEIESLLENTKKAGIFEGGFRGSNANYYFFLDSDNSFFEEDILKAINLIEDGYYDIIQATKDMTAENRPLVRRLLSMCKRACTYFFLPKGIYDSQTGFKVVNANFAKHAIPFIRNEYGFAADLQLLNICKNLNFRALQLPVKCVDQEGSHVELVADTKRYLLSLLKIAFTKEVYHYFK